jgi:hypothetical protein
MTTFKQLGRKKQSDIVQDTVRAIEAALAKIGMDPDGVMVLIDDGERVAVHFHGTDNSAAAMVQCVNERMGKPSCCKSR